MAAVFKQQAHKLIDELPDSAGWEELAEQFETILDIEAGLADSAADRVTDNVQVRREFETVGQQRVIALTMAINTGSRRVMESVGMRYVRTHHPQWDEPLPGAEYGEVEYEISRETWFNCAR